MNKINFYKFIRVFWKMKKNKNMYICIFLVFSSRRNEKKKKIKSNQIRQNFGKKEIFENKIFVENKN